MPAERREIIFSADELLEATKYFLARRQNTEIGQKAKTAGDLKEVKLHKAETVEATARFLNKITQEINEIRLGPTDLGAILTMHCLTNRIPLPKRAAKAVQVIGDDIVLVVTIPPPKNIL